MLKDDSVGEDGFLSPPPPLLFCCSTFNGGGVSGGCMNVLRNYM